MSRRTKELGATGEKIASAFLRKKGYSLLAKNFSCPLGEIDLIAKDKTGEIVFIEVKTRIGVNYGQPEDSINRNKKRQLIKTALVYLKKYRLTEEACRFDVISILITDQSPSIRLIKDAFWCEEVDYVGQGGIQYSYRD